MADMTAVLTAAQSPDPATRQAAEAQLAALEAANFTQFVGLLLTELSGEAKPPLARKLAGLILKNALYSDDAVKRAEKAAKWAAVEPGTKAQIRAALLATLASPVLEARQTAAMVVGKVGALDLARKEWPELIPQLQSNVAAQAAGAKQATLAALGYVCEDLDSSALEQAQVNTVLTAVVAGMGKGEEAATRAVATRALDNALVFASANFKSEGERNYIMQVVCEGAVAPEQEVRLVSMECLANICAKYYEVMQAYVPSIFTITNTALSNASESEEVQAQALLVWSNICEVEEALQEEDEETFNFGVQAAPQLVPLLLSVLPSRGEPEEEDDDSWGVSKGAHYCLQSLAFLVGDAVLDAVMPFVQSSVASPDWRAREAAVNAFAAVVAGPDPGRTVPMARSALPSLLSMMKDPTPPVRRAAAYAVYYCVDMLHVCAGDDTPQLLTPEVLPPLLAALTEAVGGEDEAVSDWARQALGKLAEGYAPLANQPSGPLSPYFQTMAQTLLMAADRGRPLAYDQLCDLVSAATAADGALLAQLLPHVLAKLSATMDGVAPAGADGLQAQADAQGPLCGVLQILTSRLHTLGGPHHDALMSFADALMATYLRVFACRAATVHSEALLAVSTLVDACGVSFQKYMQAFWPVLELGLRNFAEYEVCASAVELVGDLCRALDKDFAPYADAIMLALFTDLSSNELSAVVKPNIISVFGDVAIALGPAFDRYLVQVSQMLAGAAQHTAVKAAAAAAAGDEAGIEANNKLRTAILEAYCLIIQGMKEDAAKCTALLVPQAPSVLEFVVACCVDPHALNDDALLLAAVGLVGDLSELPGVAPAIAQRAELHQLLQRCTAADADPTVRRAALHAQQVVQANLQAGAGKA